MDKRKKYLSLCISLITLSVFCFTGCGKEKTTGEESYSVNEVTAMKINADTWNTDIMVSADENIHIHFDGRISNGEEKPSTSLKNGVLFVANGIEVSEANSCEETLEDYFKRVTGGEGIA